MINSSRFVSMFSMLSHIIQCLTYGQGEAGSCKLVNYGGPVWAGEAELSYLDGRYN